MGTTYFYKIVIHLLSDKAEINIPLGIKAGDAEEAITLLRASGRFEHTSGYNIISVECAGFGDIVERSEYEEKITNN